MKYDTDIKLNLSFQLTVHRRSGLSNVFNSANMYDKHLLFISIVVWICQEIIKPSYTNQRHFYNFSWNQPNFCLYIFIWLVCIFMKRQELWIKNQKWTTVKCTLIQWNLDMVTSSESAREREQNMKVTVSDIYQKQVYTTRCAGGCTRTTMSNESNARDQQCQMSLMLENNNVKWV